MSTALGSDRLFGEMEAIQQRALLVDGGFGRIEVLRGLRKIIQQPSPQGTTRPMTL